jgi:Cu/Ag efflux protein CusF
MAKRLNSGKSKTTNIAAFRLVGNNGLGGDDEYAEANQVADTLTNAQVKTKYEANSDTNVFTNSEQTKLSNIQDGAEVNPTSTQIKTLYESNSDTNAFTNDEQTKLSNIEVGAEVQDLTINTEETGNFTTSTGSGNTFTYCNSASGIQTTITDAACDIGKILSFNQKGAGVVTFVGDSGVTLRNNLSGALVTTGQDDTVIFLKVASNTYQMI